MRVVYDTRGNNWKNIFMNTFGSNDVSQEKTGNVALVEYDNVERVSVRPSLRRSSSLSKLQKKI